MIDIELTDEEFRLFSYYIHKVSGIYLDSSKDYLIKNRLNRLVKSTNSHSFLELYTKVIADKTGQLEESVINIISTNETSFFRDRYPFEMIKDHILPNIINHPTANRSIDIWSTACSTGQEVYTMGIILKELLGTKTSFSINILGTDISNNVIESANKGCYNVIEIERGLDNSLKGRYFHENGDQWEVADSIKSLTTFKQLNLLDDFSDIGVFDIILCRNVAIYFDESNKADLFNRLGRQLKNGGYLIIGSTESITYTSSLYKMYRYEDSIYYKLD